MSIVDRISKGTFDGSLELCDISFVYLSHSDILTLEGLSLQVEIGHIIIC